MELGNLGEGGRADAEDFNSTQNISIFVYVSVKIWLHTCVRYCILAGLFHVWLWIVCVFFRYCITS